METIPLEHKCELDPRLTALSYSSRLLLHQCPRKYQLQKLSINLTDVELEEEGGETAQITLNFGSIVGIGIQSSLEGKSEDQCILDMFLAWEPDLFASDDKKKKSFWYAVQALRSFLALRTNGFLSDWELFEYESKPAVELSFRIH